MTLDWLNKVILILCKWTKKLPVKTTLSFLITTHARSIYYPYLSILLHKMIIFWQPPYLFFTHCLFTVVYLHVPIKYLSTRGHCGRSKFHASMKMTRPCSASSKFTDTMETRFFPFSCKKMYIISNGNAKNFMTLLAWF